MKPILVAELGINHGGDVAKAIKMAKVAVDSGADAVKLQYYDADKLVAYRKSVGQIVTADVAALLAKCHLSLSDICRVRDAVPKTKVFASVFDPDDVLKYVAAGFDWVKLSVEQGQRPSMREAVCSSRAHVSRLFVSINKSLVAWGCMLPCHMLLCPPGYPVASLSDLHMDDLSQLVSWATWRGLASPGLSLHAGEDTDYFTLVPLAYGLGARVFEFHFRLCSDEVCPEAAWSCDSFDFVSIRNLLDTCVDAAGGDDADAERA